MVAPNGTIPSPAAAAPLTSPSLSPGPAPLSSPPLVTTPNTIYGPSLAPSPDAPSPGIAPGPTATFQGTIQPPSGWDPYAAPGQNAAPLFPNDPYLQAPALGMNPPLTKLLQEIRFEHFYIAPLGGTKFGSNDSEISATFAYPFFYNRQMPILITPGFGLHLWDGPITDDGFDLPPRVYDGYLDAAWLPQITPWLGADLGVRVGVHSDFQEFVAESIRVQGRGYAVLSFSPSFQVKAGVIYLNRNRVKLLPAGGVIWTPNPDWRFDILFPNPKVAVRWRTVGLTEWWWYLRGDYGGGTWTVKHETGEPGLIGRVDSIDYNDLRVAGGLQFLRSPGLHGFAEVGFAFNREILYFPVDPLPPTVPATFNPNQTPSETIFVGAGLAF